MSHLMHLRSQQKPACAKLNTWETLEANGLIYVWYHIEGIGPTWRPVILDQLDQSSKSRWVYQGRNEFEVRHVKDFKIRPISRSLPMVCWLEGLHNLGEKL